MQFLNKFRRPSNQETKQVSTPNLNPLFNEMLELEDSPFGLALEELTQLENSSNSAEEFLNYLLEDTVFSSLHLTFYEKLISILGEHPHLALQMMDKFSEDTEEREFILSKETLCHVQYIENQGICHGCEAHENHQDVNALIGYYHEKDLDFFIRLYLGMKTIQFSFDKLLYDELPSNPSLFVGQTDDTILEFRKYIFNHVSDELNRM